MQIIGNLFNIIMFVSVIGGIFTILSLLVNRIFHFTVPLWFSVCGMTAYIIPLIAPDLYLIPPEEQTWQTIYHKLCIAWLCGVIFFILWNIIQTSLAHRALKNYCICIDERITAICTRCCKLADLKRTPSIYFGTLSDPACVTGVLEPVLILKESIVKQLSDTELTTVICHEVTHIKRRHILLGHIYNCICILNWFNPLVWIAKKDFAVHCEVDCDKYALISLDKEITDTEYANAMIHLLKLTAIHVEKKEHRLSALGFLLTKQRMKQIMVKPTKIRKIFMIIILSLMLITALSLSIMLSRGHFYPYPAYDTDTEYSYIEQ